MGQEGAQQVAQEIGLINDQALQNYVQGVGAAIAAQVRAAEPSRGRSASSTIRALTRSRCRAASSSSRAVCSTS